MTTTPVRLFTQNMLSWFHLLPNAALFYNMHIFMKLSNKKYLLFDSSCINWYMNDMATIAQKTTFLKINRSEPYLGFCSGLPSLACLLYSIFSWVAWFMMSKPFPIQENLINKGHCCPVDNGSSEGDIHMQISELGHMHIY